MAVKVLIDDELPPEKLAVLLQEDDEERSRSRLPRLVTLDRPVERGGGGALDVLPNTPPHSTDSEQSILGGLLLDPAAFGRVEWLKAEDFYHADHRAIYRAIVAMLGAGQPVDALLVSEELQARGELERVGGQPYIGSLSLNTPSAANIQGYARVVRERAAQRQWMALGNEIYAKASAPGADIEALRAEAVASINAVPVSVRAKPESLNWKVLSQCDVPKRSWDMMEWLVRGHPHLLVGGGGTGKSTIAQQIESCFALGRDFIGTIPHARRVLAWHCEDDEDEIWRRQLGIARWLNVPLDSFAANLIIEPRLGKHNVLMGDVGGRLATTLAFEELRQHTNDVGAQVVVLDNVAHVFGGKEADRHQVTVFINTLMGALPGCTIILLGHPARSLGSEYSGSSAWENAVRARFYLGRDLPDQKIDDEAPVDDTVRYLARRKVNYSARDWRRFTYRDGVLIPDQVETETDGVLFSTLQRKKAERVVLEGLRKLAGMNVRAVHGASSPAFLPRVLLDYKLAEGCSKKELADAMREHMSAGLIKQGVVGKYANRTPMEGLIAAD